MSDPVPPHLDGAVARTPTCEVDGRHALVRVPGIGRALVDQRGVVTSALDPSAPDGAASAIELPATALGHVLAGRFPLRGAAVARGDHALAITAAPGGGASTIAAALALDGASILADGCVVIDEGRVLHSRSDVDLWPDAAAAVGIPTGAGRRLRHDNAKATYQLGPGREAPVQLAGIVEIVIDNAERQCTVGTLTGFDAAAAVVRATWHTWCHGALGRDGAHLSWVTAIVRAHPVVCVRVPHDRAHLGVVLHDAVREVTGAIEFRETTGPGRPRTRS